MSGPTVATPGPAGAALVRLGARRTVRYRSGAIRTFGHVLVLGTGDDLIWLPATADGRKMYGYPLKTFELDTRDRPAVFAAVGAVDPWEQAQARVDAGLPAWPTPAS